MTKVSTCSQTGCTETLHPLCQSQWEESRDIHFECAEELIGDYCYLHHPKMCDIGLSAMIGGGGDDDDAHDDDDDKGDINNNDDDDDKGDINNNDDDDDSDSDSVKLWDNLYKKKKFVSTRVATKAKPTKAAGDKLTKAAAAKATKAAKAKATKATKVKETKATKVMKKASTAKAKSDKAKKKTTATATATSTTSSAAATTSTQCDWENSPEGCCSPLGLLPINCQYVGCNRLVHHLCQIHFETSHHFEENNIGTYCTQHSPAFMEYTERRNEESFQRDTAIALAVCEEINLCDLDTVLFGNPDTVETVDDGAIDAINDEFANITRQPYLSDDAIDDDSEYYGDSDDCGSEAELHDTATEFDSEGPTIDDYYGVAGTKTVIRGQGHVVLGPADWDPPAPPVGWEYNPPDGVPSEENTDNPGKWNMYSYAPKMNKGNYEGHFTPAGATVLPEDSDGIRETNGWKFHYDGWKMDEFDKSVYVRDDAQFGNLKPKSRAGYLDADTLRKHGLSSERMKDDPLFFFQLLFPINDPSNSGIEDDNRMPYFTHASMCTNIYAAARGGGSGVGHDWANANVVELVNWTGIPIYNGALDGHGGSINARWDKSDARFDPIISASMTKTRFRDIKRNFKLNNNYLQTKAKGDVGYDPCTKFDMPYRVLIHNMNNVTGQADLDNTLDESTWGFGGYMGDVGGKLIGKPVDRGGQIAMIYDINRRYPRGYVHRHKCHERVAPFKSVGQSEVVMLVDQLDRLITGNGMPPTTTLMHPTNGIETVYQMKTIYTKPPHIVCDNLFVSDAILDFMGAKGYGITGTVARNRIPAEVKPYTHHGKVDAKLQRCRAMRFENPIVAIKQCEATEEGKAYFKSLVSFQSTGGTNIMGVNNLPSVKLYVHKRKRGNRVWGIEQNEARETYLRHYYGLDSADHMVKNTGNQFISRKYWHAPYRHVITLGIIAAYDMYIECCEGNLDASWMVEDKLRMKFRAFRLLLAKQMLQYNPSKGMYPGDDKLRAFTQKHKKRRSSGDNDGVSKKVKMGKNNEVTEVTYESFKQAIYAGRLCTTLEGLQEHFNSVVRTTNSETCEVCGKKTIWRCNLCNKSICTIEKRKWNGVKCMFTYHNPEFFGLARSECHEPKEWEAPTPQVKEKNGRMIKRWMSNFKSE